MLLTLATLILDSSVRSWNRPTVEALLAIAYIEGKHPPEFMFMLFSMGGAIGILAVTLLGGEGLATVLRPITVIGGNPCRHSSSTSL